MLTIACPIPNRDNRHCIALFLITHDKSLYFQGFGNKPDSLAQCAYAT